MRDLEEIFGKKSMGSRTYRKPVTQSVVKGFENVEKMKIIHKSFIINDLINKNSDIPNWFLKDCQLGIFFFNLYI